MINDGIMTATIKQVAQRAGVSMSTVSHVLNNTHYVSPELTERVLAAVDALDYQLNPIARSLAGGRTKVIGLLAPEMFVSYGGMITRGIDEELANAGYEMMLYTTHNKQDKETSFVNTLARGLTEGLLLLIPNDPSAYLAPLRQQKYPYVVIDQQGFDNFSSTVVTTNWRGAYEATQYLIELGHERIGFIAGRDVISSSRERLAGYQAALDAAGIAFDPALVGRGEFLRAVAYKATEILLDLRDPPTAIFAANDVSAFGVVDAVRNRDLKIPHDISIIGFDDIPEAAAMRPALTTVRQPLVEMGRAATQLLLEYIENPDLHMRQVILETELIIRESCVQREERLSTV